MAPKSSSAHFKSIIRTRDRNKTVHPGEPDQAMKRRSHAEMEAIRVQDAADKASEEEHQRVAIAKAAQIEDELREAEKARERAAKQPKPVVAAFRPPDRMPATRRSSSEVIVDEDQYLYPKVIVDEADNEPGTQRGRKVNAQELSDVDDEYDEYRSRDIESEDSPYSEDEEAKLNDRKRKSKKPNRDDITAARHVQSQRSSSTLVSDSTRSGVSQTVTKKSKTRSERSAPSGFLPGWKPSKSNTNNGIDKISTDNDSAVRYGGLVGDDENDAVEAAAVSKATAATSRKPITSMIRINERPTTSREPTKKEIRGGTTKWQLKHLPEDADPDAFTSLLTPLVKIKAGTLDPWAGLSTAQIQEIVDEVYGPGRFTVKAEDVWSGLIGYRLQNWRNAFSSVAINAVKGHMDDSDMPPSQIVEAVDVFLTPAGDPPSAPYFWRDWEIADDDSVKRAGRCQNDFVLNTFALAHLIEYEVLPDAYRIHDDELPVGALILAHQAIEHAFKMWKSGELIQPDSRKPAGQFSYDNYADYTQHVKPTVGSSKSRKVLKRRATKHVPTVKSLSRDAWNNIFTEAATYINRGKKRKRSRSASSRGSDRLEDFVHEDEDYEEIVLESDE